jgi:outer membrane protein
MRAAFVFIAAIILIVPNRGRAQSSPPTPQPDVASLSATAADGAPSANARTLTRAQAEALALKNNPQISVGRLNALVAHQYVREQRAALLPTVYLNVTAVGSDPGTRMSAGALNNPSMYPRAAAGATVSQLITDFGRTTNLVSSAEFQAKAQDQTAAATTADVVLATDQVFFNTLETQALVTVAQQTVDTRQTFVDKIQALTNAKLRSDLDLSFAKVDCYCWKRKTITRPRSRRSLHSQDSAMNKIFGW